MIVTINDKLINEWNIMEDIKVYTINKYTNKENYNQIKHKPIFDLLLAGVALSTGDFSGLERIITLFQNFAYYVGLGYAIWGTIEYAMDNPAGSTKSKKAIIGFIGVYIIPVIFKAIRDALS